MIERDSIVLAKEVASLDRISDGRVILGVGAGWNVEETESHGTSCKQRWKILRERVLAMREIWTRDVAQFHGEFVDFKPLWSWPKPIQKPAPKVLLGSKSQRSFERVVDYCDGWMPIGRPAKQSSIFGILQRDVLSTTQYLGVLRERMRRFRIAALNKDHGRDQDTRGESNRSRARRNVLPG